MIIVELCKVKRTINIKLGEKGRIVSQSHIHSASHHIISRQALFGISLIALKFLYLMERWATEG